MRQNIKAALRSFVPRASPGPVKTTAMVAMTHGEANPVGRLEVYGPNKISPGSSMVCGTIAAAVTPEIVTNAIVAAISAGAVAGATDTAKSAIADAYQGLKSLIKKKFGYDSDVAEAIDKVEAKPDSDPWKQILTEELKAANLTSDAELVTAAQSLLSLIRALPQGKKHIQVAEGTDIAQADRGSTTTVTMLAPPRKDD
jgi:hypothetical protein